MGIILHFLDKEHSALDAAQAYHFNFRRVARPRGLKPNADTVIEGGPGNRGCPTHSRSLRMSG